MSERLDNLSASSSEQPVQPESQIPEPEDAIGSVNVDYKELLKSGVTFAMEHGGLDRKEAHQIIYGRQPKK